MPMIITINCCARSYARTNACKVDDLDHHPIFLLGKTLSTFQVNPTNLSLGLVTLSSHINSSRRSSCMRTDAETDPYGKNSRDSDYFSFKAACALLRLYICTELKLDLVSEWERMMMMVLYHQIIIIISASAEPLSSWTTWTHDASFNIF